MDNLLVIWSLNLGGVGKLQITAMKLNINSWVASQVY